MERKKMFKLIFNYIVKHLSIYNDKFVTMLLDAFIVNDMAFLSSMLEKEHLDKLQQLFENGLKKNTTGNEYLNKTIHTSIMEYIEQPCSDDSEEDVTKIGFNLESVDKQEIVVDNAKTSDISNILHSGSVDKQEIVVDSDISNILDRNAQSNRFSYIPKVNDVREKCGLSGYIRNIEADLDEGSDNIATVEDKIDEIVRCLKENDVVIVQGDTGCGKTTKIPLALLKHFKRVVCTEPRQIAAISAADRVAKMAKCSVGDLVGYRIRFDDKTSDRTRLYYVTDGILLNELTCDRRGCRDGRVRIYDLIIIDEAHERSLNIDFLLGYLKLRHEFKMIVMSATLNTEKLINYFSCPVVTIRHKMFPITYHYLRKPAKCYFEMALKTAAGLSKKRTEGDILVFLTGAEEIDEGVEILQKILDLEKNEICRLYSAISSDEQNNVFLPGKRKIILATNIAETSITIKNVKYVVDCGKMKQLRQMSNAAINRLEVVDISRAHAKQRGGRAGRTSPGYVYRIYTHEEYEKMAEEGIPEILRLNLHGVILSLKCMGVHDPVNFNYIDRPPLTSIFYSIKFLYYLRALDGYGRVTRIGRMLAAQPLAPEMAMVILNARCDGTTDIISTIIAFLTVSNFFAFPEGRFKKEIVQKYWHKKGEFYMFLNIYYDWKQHKFSKKYLMKNYLKISIMDQVLKIKAQLMGIYSHNIRIELLKLPDINNTKIHSMLENCAIERAFCAGFFMNIAHLESKNEYKSIFGDFTCTIHSSDILCKSNPKYVLFYEIKKTKKYIMRHCLEIDKNTLFKACNRNIL